MAEFTRSFTPELEVRSGGDGRTITGIAVPYNRPQRIDSRLTEQFARGAFNQQIRSASRVSLARGHIVLGGILIGKATMLRDDAAGLYVELRASATPTGDETLELVRDGALTDLSVAFQEGQNRQVSGGITERVTARLTEVAVVDEGAYGEAARVLAVRTAATDARCQLDQIIASLPVLSAQADILTRVPLGHRY